MLSIMNNYKHKELIKRVTDIEIIETNYNQDELQSGQITTTNYFVVHNNRLNISVLH